MVATSDANAPILTTYCPVVNAKSIGYDGLRTDFWGQLMPENGWQDRVKGLLKAELKRRNVSYRGLAEKLGEFGIQETEANIKNKISRGGFTAVFFVQCLIAIGCNSLRLEDS